MAEDVTTARPAIDTANTAEHPGSDCNGVMNVLAAPFAAEASAARTRARKTLWCYAIIFVVVSFPFSFLHLAANPDDARITPLQHLAAAAANCSGPWGVLMVRLVDFPNAGLRAFSWPVAVGMTLLGCVLIGLPLWFRLPALQLLCAFLWGFFTIAWFLVGLTQIASGLL